MADFRIVRREISHKEWMRSSATSCGPGHVYNVAERKTFFGWKPIISNGFYLISKYGLDQTLKDFVYEEISKKMRPKVDIVAEFEYTDLAREIGRD